MKLNLFHLLYLSGLIPVAVPILQTIPHKYDLIMTPMLWPEAKNYCRVMHDDLATLLGDLNLLRFNKEVESNALTSSAWVGLYNGIDSWRWSLNELLVKNVGYSNWAGRYPSNYGDQKYACAIFGYLHKWWDGPCGQLFPFICYDANFDDADKFIGITSSKMIWTDAQAYCRAHHTDLASSLNSSDNALLGQIKDIQGDSWIGLYRDTWRWSDGTDTSDLPWVSGQPDNSGGNEDCAVVNNGLLSDEPCTNPHYFFCHTLFPKKGQIIRLQIKFEGSVTTVQSSIFELIKEKLLEKHVFNVTLTWRVQPDGHVFQRKKDDKL